jgi:Phospholipase_D-nuclease N-terminal
VYFAFAAIYVVLSIAFIVDVLRQPPSALSGVGKALWILALLLVPLFAWIV